MIAEGERTGTSSLRVAVPSLPPPEGKRQGDVPFPPFSLGYGYTWAREQGRTTNNLLTHVFTYQMLNEDTVSSGNLRRPGDVKVALDVCLGRYLHKCDQ